MMKNIFILSVLLLNCVVFNIESKTTGYFNHNSNTSDSQYNTSFISENETQLDTTLTEFTNDSISTKQTRKKVGLVLGGGGLRGAGHVGVLKVL